MAWVKWALLIGIPLLLLLYEIVLRVCFGLVIVPEDRIGLVTKKFVLVGKQALPHILIGGNGEGGSGPISGLLGLQLLEQLRKKTDDDGQKK